MDDGKGIKILVVDDEPSILESFKMILSIKDFDVVTAPTGEEGVNIVDQDYFDIAFVDLRLPGIDGIEVLKRIKQKSPSTEVVIVTAFASEESQAKAITVGAMEYLRKPFLMEEIYNLVDRAIRRKADKSRKKDAVPIKPDLGTHM